tara:strand:- start:213 stop:425 length:213 start_codon:yes stop_codon:yes gene_type:complete
MPPKIKENPNKIKKPKGETPRVFMEGSRKKLADSLKEHFYEKKKKPKPKSKSKPKSKPKSKKKSKSGSYK